MEKAFSRMLLVLKQCEGGIESGARTHDNRGIIYLSEFGHTFLMHIKETIYIAEQAQQAEPQATADDSSVVRGNSCSCKECGSTNLTWHTSNVIRSNVQQGRLNTNDVECLFYLGCDDCSETLMTLNADKVAGMLGSVAAAQKGGA